MEPPAFDNVEEDFEAVEKVIDRSEMEMEPANQDTLFHEEEREKRNVDVSESIVGRGIENAPCKGDVVVEVAMSEKLDIACEDRARSPAIDRNNVHGAVGVAKGTLLDGLECSGSNPLVILGNLNSEIFGPEEITSLSNLRPEHSPPPQNKRTRREKIVSRSVMHLRPRKKSKE